MFVAVYGCAPAASSILPPIPTLKPPQATKQSPFVNKNPVNEIAHAHICEIARTVPLTNCIQIHIPNQFVVVDECLKA